MKFCSHCGKTVALSVPQGDNRPRYVCMSCGTVHYQNPLIVAGCVPEHDGRILLCKRAIEPRYGFWTVPAGFMELDETLREAAARETLEESLANVTIGPMVAAIDVLRAQQVHIFFSGRLTHPQFGAGEETLEARMYLPEDIPWDDLAFPSVRLALEQHLKNRASGRDDLLICEAPGRPSD